MSKFKGHILLNTHIATTRWRGVLKMYSRYVPTKKMRNLAEGYQSPKMG